ncbi:phosphoenolpyruvate--protein phosphotransferase [Halobacterium noricense]|uniref:phosphoenolpyruvate--protein phosphotransferase n=1 Tax=Halobacterium noricense TaxID=223182 RepID=UPI001E4D8858|nr:phosphoenolpyruvate--protein phosphotransferase [Halobacterium noricense]UHH26843.1 phosphoenolpyruvate--protein phosphotransferase [Halobacterium noricense]
MAQRVLSGAGAVPSSGVGIVAWYEPDAELPDPPDPERVDGEAEHERYEAAREEAREELQVERERLRERVGEEEADVFGSHIQFLDDPQLIEPVETEIEGGLPAEHAVVEGFKAPISQFESMEGRMAERADDLRDLRDRLVRILTDSERTDLTALPKGTILLAERLTPSDTAQLDPDRIAGFVTAVGGRTSHAAIFARSLAIPAVVGVGEELLAVESESEVVVDGDAGEVVVEPDEETKERAAGGRDVEILEGPVETSDGRQIEVAANLGTAAELAGAVEQGADGIGLFRTEFLFLDRERPPDEDEQYETYAEALRAFPDGRVVVRTLDIGGDKPIPYLDLPDEENPFLGQRGIRRSLGPDGDLFETQLRALLRAAAVEGGDLAVMFPMVATVSELDNALAAVESVAERLEAANVSHGIPELGVMVETPGAAFTAPEFADQVDFLSIGTNDLIQYVMAAARENDAVADLHDPRHPAVLRAIKRCVESAEATDAWVGMCGEMAGDPALTELLVGLGLDELSMSAITVPDVKRTITETDSEDAAALAESALAAETKAEVDKILRDKP